MHNRLMAQPARMRAYWLLDMLYTTDDLAYELGIGRDEITQNLIPNGLPHAKDGQGRIWIHGLTMSKWPKAQSTGEVCPSSEAGNGRIHRENYLAVRAYLDYQKDVMQLDAGSVRVKRAWLNYLLKWAGPSHFKSAADKRLIFPQYGGGQADESATAGAPKPGRHQRRLRLCPRVPHLGARAPAHHAWR